MEALDNLEKRIDTLSRLLGPLPVSEADSPDSKPSSIENESIVDSLISTNSLLSSATKDREQILKTISRAPELEKYLNPDFLEENQYVHAKEVYLNAVAPDLHNQFEQLALIKKLESTLGAEYFRNIPEESVEKLKQINNDNCEFQQKTELIEESLILAMKRYGDIQADIITSMDKITTRLENIEKKIIQKKKEELEKDIPNTDGK